MKRFTVAALLFLTACAPPRNYNREQEANPLRLVQYTCARTAANDMRVFGQIENVAERTVEVTGSASYVQSDFQLSVKQFQVGFADDEGEVRRTYVRLLPEGQVWFGDTQDYAPSFGACTFTLHPGVKNCPTPMAGGSCWVGRTDQ